MPILVRLKENDDDAEGRRVIRGSRLEYNIDRKSRIFFNEDTWIEVATDNIVSVEDVP